MLKHCTGCNRDLEANRVNFRLNKSRKDGLSHNCRQCADRYTKQSRAPSQQVKRWQTRNEIILYIKQKYGCYFHGLVPTECIEFHHIDPNGKEGVISRIAGEEAFITEILKCIPVCANCHRQIHAGTKRCPTSSNIQEDDIRNAHKPIYVAPKLDLQLHFDFDAVSDDMIVTRIRITKSGKIMEEKVTWGSLKLERDKPKILKCAP